MSSSFDVSPRFFDRGGWYAEPGTQRRHFYLAESNMAVCRYQSNVKVAPTLGNDLNTNNCIRCITWLGNINYASDLDQQKVTVEA